MHLLGTTRTTAILLLALPLLQSSAWARPTLVLLPPQQQKITIPALMEQLERTITEVGRPVKRSALKLDELMLAVECSDKSVACLQKIGTNLEADGLILGQVGGSADRPVLTLRWFDVKSGGDRGRAEVPLAGDANHRAEMLRQGARALFGMKEPTTPRDLTGGLTITATLPYVEILLDGQARGTAPLELRNLPARRYPIEARLSGYSTWSGTVDVKPNEMNSLEIEMSSSMVRRGRAPSYLESIRARTWLAAGLGGACLVVGVAFGAHMRAQQNELDSTNGDTFEEIARMEQVRDTGERDALVANIMLGVGGAALLTSALLSYLDYRRARREFDGFGSTRAALDVGPGSVRLRLSF